MVHLICQELYNHKDITGFNSDGEPTWGKAILFLATTRHAADDDESTIYCRKNDAQLFRVSGDSKACKCYAEISKTDLACRTKEMKVCKIEQTLTNKRTKLRSPRDQNTWVCVQKVVILRLSPSTLDQFSGDTQYESWRHKPWRSLNRTALQWES